MIGTAYELTCLFARLIYRFGKWLIVPQSDTEAEGDVPATPVARAGRPRSRAATSEAAQPQAESSAMEAPSAESPPGPISRQMTAKVAGEAVVEAATAGGSENAWHFASWAPPARIQTRDGPGYRVHFYFRSGDSAVRRVAMFDFVTLRERFGVAHAAAIHARIGFRPRRRVSRVRDLETKWGRLPLPDAQADCPSPYDMPALAMIDRTMAEVERFVSAGEFPPPVELAPAAVRPTAKSRTAAKSPKASSAGGIGGTSMPIPPVAPSDTAAPASPRRSGRSSPVPLGNAEIVAAAMDELGAGSALASAAASGTDRPAEKAGAAASPVAKAGTADSPAVQGVGACDGPAAVPAAGETGGNEAVKENGPDPDWLTAAPGTGAEYHLPAGTTYGVQCFVGIFVESGLAERTALSSGRRFTSFYVDLDSDGCIVRHTGADLQRALRLIGAEKGDRIELTYHGSVPLSGGKLRKKLWKANMIEKAAVPAVP